MIEKCWLEDPNNRPTFSEIYNKLSLTEDGYFNDLNSKNCKSIIESKNDNEMFNLSNKFCFDGVDVQKIFSYVNEISDKTKVEKNDEEIESLKKEIEIQKKEIESLKKEINKMNNCQNQSQNQFKKSTEIDDKLTQTDFQQVTDSKMKQDTKKVKEKIYQTKNEEKQQARTIIV